MPTGTYVIARLASKLPFYVAGTKPPTGNYLRPRAMLTFLPVTHDPRLQPQDFSDSLLARAPRLSTVAAAAGLRGIPVRMNKATLLRATTLPESRPECCPEGLPSCCRQQPIVLHEQTPTTQDVLGTAQDIHSLRLAEDTAEHLHQQAMLRHILHALGASLNPGGSVEAKVSAQLDSLLDPLTPDELTLSPSPVSGVGEERRPPSWKPPGQIIQGEHARERHVHTEAMLLSVGEHCRATVVKPGPAGPGTARDESNLALGISLDICLCQLGSSKSARRVGAPNKQILYEADASLSCPRTPDISVFGPPLVGARRTYVPSAALWQSLRLMMI